MKDVVIFTDRICIFCLIPVIICHLIGNYFFVLFSMCYIAYLLPGPKSGKYLLSLLPNSGLNYSQCQVLLT